MKQEKKLIIGMALLFLLVFVTFGSIIANEKLAPFYTEKIEEKFKNYIKENYPDIEKDIILDKVTYKRTKYQSKVHSKKNKHLYFFLYYQDKKITDDYIEQYVKGTSLLKKLEQDIQKEINKKTDVIATVTMNKTLNNYTKAIQEKLIEEKSISNLKVYTISLKLNCKEITTEAITEKIFTLNDKLNKNSITPSHYNITITIEKDEEQIIKINDLPTTIIESPTLSLIINDIINKKESTIIKENKITYSYLSN